MSDKDNPQSATDLSWGENVERLVTNTLQWRVKNLSDEVSELRDEARRAFDLASGEKPEQDDSTDRIRATVESLRLELDTVRNALADLHIELKAGAVALEKGLIERLGSLDEMIRGSSEAIATEVSARLAMIVPQSAPLHVESLGEAAVEELIERVTKEAWRTISVRLEALAQEVSNSVQAQVQAQLQAFEQNMPAPAAGGRAVVRNDERDKIFTAVIEEILESLPASKRKRLAKKLAARRAAMPEKPVAPVVSREIRVRIGGR